MACGHWQAQALCGPLANAGLRSLVACRARSSGDPSLQGCLSHAGFLHFCTSQQALIVVSVCERSFQVGSSKASYIAGSIDPHKPPAPLQHGLIHVLEFVSDVLSLQSGAKGQQQDSLSLLTCVLACLLAH